LAERLSAPIRIAAMVEHPRIAGRYRVECHHAPDDEMPAHPPVVVVLGVAGIAALGLKRGVVLDTGQVATLVHEVAVTSAMDAAVRLLARGRKSERDLQIRLRRREPDGSVVSAALERLREAGLVNDAEFARAEASARLPRGKESASRVASRLRRRGVSAALVDNAISDAREEHGVDESADCLALAERRARQLASYEPTVQRRRLTAFLLRRGFRGDAVATAVRRVLPR
jgi:regulatory protein